MRHVTFLFSAMLFVALASGIALVPTTVRADAPCTESVKCTLVELVSHPSFTQGSPGCRPALDVHTAPAADALTH